MKSIMLSFILSITCYASVFAQLNELPSTEKKWTIKNYKSFNDYLDGLSLDSYPNLKNEKTKPLFQKLLATDYKDILNDEAIDLNTKIPYVLDYQKNMRDILGKYLIAHTKGNDYGIELMHLLGTTIEISAEMVPLLKEFLKTIDVNDESYQIRMNGLMQMKDGLKQQLEGALIVVKDIENSSDEERIILVKYFVISGASILNFLDEADQKEFKIKIEEYLPIEPNQKIKELLSELVAKI